MKIRILTVGKVDNKNIQSLIDLYVKRIHHYLSIAIEFVESEKIKNQPEQLILSVEGKRLSDKIEQSDYTVVMDRTGSQLSSIEFADFFEKIFRLSKKRITFIIGGPIGICEEMKKKADVTLSISKMTIPHELALLFLVEQIYRAHSILRGEKYHK